MPGYFFTKSFVNKTAKSKLIQLKGLGLEKRDKQPTVQPLHPPALPLRILRSVMYPPCLPGRMGGPSWCWLVAPGRGPQALTPPVRCQCLNPPIYGVPVLSLKEKDFINLFLGYRRERERGKEPSDGCL